METHPLVTVIVPVYRAEATLRRCLDSILAQTISNYEVVIVDDGSPDNAGAIADEYAASHSNFRVIHQANAGSMLARRNGIATAQGQFVAMLDSDDTLPPDALQALTDFALQHDLDIVCGKYRRILPESTVMHHHPRTGTLDAKGYLRELFTPGTLCGGSYSLIATSCIKQPDIFDTSSPRIPCEDILMHSKLAAHIRRAGILDYCTYNYYFNPDSQTETGTLFLPDLWQLYFEAIRHEAARQGMAEEMEPLFRMREVESMTFEQKVRDNNHPWCRKVLSYSMKGMPRRTRLLHALLHTPRLLDVAIRANRAAKRLGRRLLRTKPRPDGNQA